MHPFTPRYGEQMRVACQILNVDQFSDGTLIDIIALEPAEWGGRRVDAGTPFTLAFVAHDAKAQRELDTVMKVWERACAVLDVVVHQEDVRYRYEFLSGHHQLVVTVDGPPDLGL